MCRCIGFVGKAPKGQCQVTLRLPDGAVAFCIRERGHKGHLHYFSLVDDHMNQINRALADIDYAELERLTIENEGLKGELEARHGKE